jgi:hypothetical protein
MRSMDIINWRGIRDIYPLIRRINFEEGVELYNDN